MSDELDRVRRKVDDLETRVRRMETLLKSIDSKTTQILSTVRTIKTRQ